MANPRVFFDIVIGKVKAGCVLKELFANVVLKTAENFRSLCTGERCWSVWKAVALQMLHLPPHHPSSCLSKRISLEAMGRAASSSSRRSIPTGAFSPTGSSSSFALQRLPGLMGSI